MKNYLQLTCLCALLLLINLSTRVYGQQQQTVTGTVTDKTTGNPLPGVTVSVKGSLAGTITDGSGNFRFNTTRQFPITLVFSSVGYSSAPVVVNSAGNITVQLASTEILGEEIVVAASRVSQSILESPVSIEKLNATAIRESPTPSFYDALPSLKGVESSVQSLTFRTITTRGFNTNGNTRFNQLMDGMDNQAPGLNFSVGNIVGISELDVASVELLPGASSALYGAGGMNGTLLMTSKSPFDYQGLSLKLQAGINHVGQKQQDHIGFIPDITARYAKAFGKFAFKLNFGYMKADDWQAVDSTNFDRLNLHTKPGFSHATDPNYDGVNVYGDEITTTFGASGGLLNGQAVSRTGYREKDLVDYSTSSLKTGAAFHYKITDNTEAIVQGNWGTGTTVYTGSDRYSLRKFNLGQYKIEIRGKRFFVRGYTTQERSGKAYNATALGTLLNEAYNPSVVRDNDGNVTGGWFAEYATVYNQARAGVFPGAPGVKTDAQAHAIARGVADRNRLMPGSAAFNQAKETITSNYIGFGAGRNGAKFNDKTNLYHYEGFYDFTDHIKVLEVQAGAAFRRYSLNSDGTIFDDADGRIKIDEVGAYLQVGKKLVNDRIKLTGSMRYDKNENFDGRFTPRISGVFTVAPRHNIRLSFQTAYRNPTNQDQYIDLPIRANTRLIGGLPELLNKYNLYNNKGYTQASVQRYAATGDPTQLQQYTFGKFRPESVSAYEIGYKGLIQNRLLIDAYYYYSAYKNFLSYTALIQPTVPLAQDPTLSSAKIFATYVNNPETVKAQGGAIGLDYLINSWTLSGNFSYNDLTNNKGELDNAFNTPKYRFNIGVASKSIAKNLGFNVMYRWQDAFVWSSSFVRGTVSAYSTVDAQVNYRIPKIRATIKVGGSNITNHYFQTSYGNPKAGAIYYTAILFDDLLK
ncbi:TonB-dependent receptor [Chitinophaga ginsengisoli]|uniref:Outer membrane receptor protein involved in Fe transport n=1 Tax=Chitinophaga ginsengisoli TaxID=363837 RepID=A0A2P8G0I4_9BACT|nr:TonB-dependent receptor [Chitinophaga ginsengisoli]PSL27480.1 outer membrane receptor protein involved in Fe transport [Chitinophaga ginsengisoli]